MENIFWIVCQFYNIQQISIEYKVHSRGWRTGGRILKVSKNKKKENLNDEKSPFSSASGDFLKADYENEGEGYVRERHRHLASNVLDLT